MGLSEKFEDALNLFCGEKIGCGIHREVFECKIREYLVVKVERGDNERNFANVFEDNFWAANSEYKDVAVWLAPCVMLSPDGMILLQKRCDPVPKNYKLPAKIPEFLTDRKISNFGIYEGRLVCVDYAITIMNPSIKLTKSEFWT